MIPKGFVLVTGAVAGDCVAEKYEISNTMQELSDRSGRFLKLFGQLSVQHGLKTAAACRKFGISRSLYYDIHSGRREATPKMEARLLEVAKLLQNRRGEVANLPFHSSDTPEVSELSESERFEAAAIMRESDEKFTKRLEDLETAARNYFEDAQEVFKEVRSLPEQGLLEHGRLIVPKGIAKSLLILQPWIEQGFAQLLKDNRTLRRIAKPKVDK